MKSNIKVAIIEQNNFHYEMILPVLLPLRKLGLELTIYCYESDLGLNDFISHIFNIEYLPRDPELIFEESNSFDLLIFTTFPCYHQSDWKKCGCYQKILNLNTPKILFIHFPELFSEIKLPIDKKNTYFFFVAPHAYKWFIENFANSYNTTRHFIYYPIFKMPSNIKKNKFQISVTGQINYYRRDYSKILEIIKTIDDREYLLYIIGRCHDNQIDKLVNETKSLGIDKNVIIKTFVKYEYFFKIIQESEFIATVLNRTKDRYFTNALTASITTAISCGTVCLVEPELFYLYPEFQPFFMSFDHFNFQKSTVIKFNEKKRNELLQINYNTLKQILSLL